MSGVEIGKMQARQIAEEQARAEATRVEAAADHETKRRVAEAIQATIDECEGTKPDYLLGHASIAATCGG